MGFNLGSTATSNGHLAHEHAEVRLHYIGNHFYLKATVFDGLYDYVDYTPDFTNWYYSWYDEDDTNNKVYGLLQDDAQPLPVYGDNIIGEPSQQEANIPRTLKTPTTPAQSEIEEHNLTHLPYRDWYKENADNININEEDSPI
eukprot:117882-Amphidinium_carterae.2